MGISQDIIPNETIHNTTQYNTSHTHSPTHQPTHTEIHHNKGVGTAHSFLKYKWAVNNVMMLSGSIYSYMICWLGFYLYGLFFCIPWYEQVSYYTINNTTPHNNCYTSSSRMLSNPFSWAWAPCECINPIYKPYIYSVQMNALNVCECVCVRTLYYIGFSLQERKKSHTSVLW